MSARGRADRKAACVTLLSQTISLYTVLLYTCDRCQLNAHFPGSPSTENRCKGIVWISYARDASEYPNFYDCIISPIALTESLLSSGIKSQLLSIAVLLLTRSLTITIKQLAQPAFNCYHFSLSPGFPGHVSGFKNVSG
jgi:hypothetical protein